MKLAVLTLQENGTRGRFEAIRRRHCLDGGQGLHGKYTYIAISICRSATHQRHMPSFPPSQAADASELSFKKGDSITVKFVDAAGWAEGTLRGQTGWFPRGAVDLPEDVGMPKQKAAKGTSQKSMAYTSPNLIPTNLLILFVQRRRKL